MARASTVRRRSPLTSGRLAAGGGHSGRCPSSEVLTRRVFGRRKRDEAAAEAAREAERRELFARLAERPENICPFLGLANERTGYVEGVSEDHRCYAFGDPAPLSAEQQTRVCQERGYGNCPRYLRGVLVIPTEELEALRRPRAMPEAPPPPTAVAEPRPRRRRLALLPLVVLLLVVVGGTAAGFAIFGSGLIGGIARETGSAIASATPTVGETVAPTTAEASATSAPSSQPASPTAVASPTPDPTPVPADVFDYWEIGVAAGDYTLYQVNSAGTLVGDRGATFSRFSRAEVQRIVASNGLLHWRTLEGEYAGLSYIYPRSGDFEVRAVYRRPDGTRSSEVIPPDER
jgi:hypothetical protein